MIKHLIVLLMFTLLNIANINYFEEIVTLALVCGILGTALSMYMICVVARLNESGLTSTAKLVTSTSIGTLYGMWLGICHRTLDNPIEIALLPLIGMFLCGVAAATARDIVELIRKVREENK